jgi:hypothetical protein
VAKVRTVEVEFTEDTFGEDGDVVRSKGDHLFVDQVSAHSFVDVKKVAKRVSEGPVMNTDKRVPPKRKKAADPEIPAATTEELASDESGDDKVDK